MAYNSSHVLFPFPASVLPANGSAPATILRGVGGTNGSNVGTRALLTHPVALRAGADCPTCNLVEIPFNPNLPALRL